ncbi:hypothetical protein COCMIDRAFT_88593 [Bipolaris oryzae ATCC 44560]|uniref:Uncharacterized protein n=1 Tax=Bipolaris oryzae ATCC 44560 TaxID=930090 RepID=W6ZD98_COCMI|nr:uncharacterized protein COCMIDRAFT_88593 [Bipolaris oryzae ATCC 44560]EUC47965.1 hypothetical protein COCMIDRAFT_88593 [Bipolaris oryzae ATCC 44560]
MFCIAWAFGDDMCFHLLGGYIGGCLGLSFFSSFHVRDGFAWRNTMLCWTRHLQGVE